MGLVRTALIGVVVLMVAIAGTGVLLVATGAVAAPTGGVEDIGDWGEVTDERTEIVSTVWVHNPNPFGLNLGGLQVDYGVEMNGVEVATGHREGIAIQPGNNTVELHTYIENERLVPWWVAYVRNDETITVRTYGEASLGTPLGRQRFTFPEQRQTMLQGETPIIDALSDAAGQMEGSYSEEFTVAGQTITAGYEVREARAEWGAVTDEETTVLYSFEVHNTGDVPLPAVPDGIELAIEMNDVALFSGGTDAMEVRNVDEDTYVGPGASQTVVLAIQLDNDKIDDWFTSHVRNGERTTVETTFRLVFRHDATGTTIRFPPGEAASYTCDIQTGILVDDQETTTDCGSAPG